MKTIPALLEVVPTFDLRITESGDELRLRSPVLSLQSDGAPLVYASAWGGPKRRQEAENALKLCKLLMERGAGESDDGQASVDVTGLQAELDGLRAALEVAEADNAAGVIADDKAAEMTAALDRIISPSVTTAKKAKEIAAAARQ